MSKTDLSRRALIAGAAVLSTTAAVATTVAVPPAAAAAAPPDPIFAAIEDHRQLKARAGRLHRDLIELQEQVGFGPVALVTWRDYMIGGREIDHRRKVLLKEGILDPEHIEREFREAKATFRKRQRAESAWKRRTGIASAEQQLAIAEKGELTAALALAKTKPTTTAGTAVLISYVHADIQEEAQGLMQWHDVALKTAVTALAEMQSGGVAS